MYDYLANMNESQLMVRLFCSIACAVMISFITSKIIGPVHKAEWFKKRTKGSFFLKRGFLGEECHFGYPHTKEGFGVTAGMMAAIALSTYIIFVI